MANWRKALNAHRPKRLPDGTEVCAVSESPWPCVASQARQMLALLWAVREAADPFASWDSDDPEVDALYVRLYEAMEAVNQHLAQEQRAGAPQVKVVKAKAGR